MQRVHRGQVYQLVGYRPHVCRDGHETQLEVWQSRCAKCGEPFECCRPVNSTKPFAPNRRCAEHKRPGSRVAKRRRRHA
jgi:hypothetical protein